MPSLLLLSLCSGTLDTDRTGIDLSPLTVNFDKLLDSSELQFSHLSSGNDNTCSITSPHIIGLPSPLLLNHAKLMLLMCVKIISYLVIITIIVNYLGTLWFLFSLGLFIF